MIEDKLIDYIFGLETLLSKEDDPIDSLSYKLALRFSRLVGKNYDEREYYFKEMKRIYTIRSKIAHGDKKSKKQMERLDIYDVEEYLRGSINKYMKLRGINNTNHDGIIDQLDFS